MGKLYGNPAHNYFEIVDNPSLDAAIDWACAAAFWEDENYHYKKSKETAQSEAGAIDQVLEQTRKQMNDRG